MSTPLWSSNTSRPSSYGNPGMNLRQPSYNNNNNNSNSSNSNINAFQSHNHGVPFYTVNVNPSFTSIATASTLSLSGTPSSSLYPLQADTGDFEDISLSDGINSNSLNHNDDYNNMNNNNISNKINNINLNTNTNTNGNTNINMNANINTKNGLIANFTHNSSNSQSSKSVYKTKSNISASLNNRQLRRAYSTSGTVLNKTSGFLNSSILPIQQSSDSYKQDYIPSHNLSYSKSRSTLKFSNNEHVNNNFQSPHHFNHYYSTQNLNTNQRNVSSASSLPSAQNRNQTSFTHPTNIYNNNTTVTALTEIPELKKNSLSRRVSTPAMIRQSHTHTSLPPIPQENNTFSDSIKYSNSLASQKSMSQMDVSRYPINSHTGLYRHSSSSFLNSRRPLNRRMSGYLRRNSLNPLVNQNVVTRLEQEVDVENDDEEVPANVVFWNVPLSPMVSVEHFNAVDLKTHSYDSKESSVLMNNNHNGRLSSTTAPLSPLDSDSEDEDDEREEDEGSSTSASTKAATPIPSLSDRIRSWDSALDNLSEDARNLSIAYAESPNAFSDEFEYNYKSSRKSPLRFPPLQLDISDVIETIPLSKTKQSQLSRTRPSWLPPKDKEEEKKHMTEFKEMMRKAVEAEKARAEKAKKIQKARDKQLIRDIQVWEHTIVPNVLEAIKNPANRELWWRGIPEAFRERVWKIRIGNKLAVSEDTYFLALKRAKEAERRSQDPKLSNTVESAQNSNLFEIIYQDIESTFTSFKLFQKGKRLHQPLVDILMAYSFYRNDVGYSTGINTIAALFLMVLSPFDTFIALANLLNRTLERAIYTHDNITLDQFYKSFLRTLRKQLPYLHRHLHETLRLTPAEYLEPMLMSLFTIHTSPEITYRIWDCMVFENDLLLLRVAIGILKTLESKLYVSKLEVLNMLGWNCKVLPLGNEDDFMLTVRNALKTE